MNSSLESKPQISLLRALGPWLATGVVVGTVIGSGVFRSPQRIAAAVPSFELVALVWIIGGLVVLLGAMSLTEVAVLFPQAGGNYIYLREGYGRLAGFLWGWVEFWIIRGASIAALATIFTESLHDILRAVHGVPSYLSFWQERLLTIAVVVGLAVVNMQGVRWGGGLQFFITLVKVGSLLAILILPFYLWGRFDPPTEMESQTIRFSWGGLAAALLFVFWPYHGWMNAATIAGEVNRPQRNIPIALLAGSGIIVFLYLGANLAYHLVIPHDDMARLEGVTTVAEFAKRLLGPIGVLLASTAVMISVFGALNGNILVGPRLLYAMGEDGMAPRALSRLHAVHRTPVVAIAILTAWSCIMIVAGGLMLQYPAEEFYLGDWPINLSIPRDKDLFGLLTDYAMFGALIFETLAVTTIFVFRRNLPHSPRPYRCPFYPWVPILYLIVPLYVLFHVFRTAQTEAFVGLGFIALGVLVYWGFVPPGEGSK